jgi:hypothetical protein
MVRRWVGIVGRLIERDERMTKGDGIKRGWGRGFSFKTNSELQTQTDRHAYIQV